MSAVEGSRSGPGWNMPSIRVAVLGVLLAVLVLLAATVATGFWGTSSQAGTGSQAGIGSQAETGSRAVPGAPAPGPTVLSVPETYLPGGGVLNGGGPVCRPVDSC
jgi:hypothetical protein